MDLKAIMVPYSGDDSEEGALRTALSLAKEHKAHVEVWHVSPNPYSLTTVFYPGQGMAPIYSEDIIAGLKKTSEDRKNVALEFFSEIADEAGVKRTEDGEGDPDNASASFCHAVGDADEIISLRSRLCDLAVISRAMVEESRVFPGVVYSTLFDSARPVLLVPAGRSVSLLNKKFIIAWNNSIEATRAVGFSLPLLEEAKVWVWGDERGSRTPSSCGGDMLPYLKLHGVRAEELLTNATTPESLLMTAQTLGASMIVMGAYSHSRFRETILGGMTNFMIKNANIPVLMAH